MIFPSQPLEILVVATHPDDAEISVGGTIARSLSQGKRVGVLDLTDGEPTPRGTPELRREETDRATGCLGLTWRHCLGLPNRKLESSLATRRELASVFRLTRPRIILAPYWDDAHPDHVAASLLADAARFWSKLSRSDMPGDPFHPPRIYYYWSIHLRIHPRPAFVVDISDFIDVKMSAIRCYASQFPQAAGETPTGTDDAHSAPSNPLDDIRDRARYWGWSIQRRYGEPFASREELGIDDLGVLL